MGHCGVLPDAGASVQARVLEHVLEHHVSHFSGEVHACTQSFKGWVIIYCQELRGKLRSRTTTPLTAVVLSTPGEPPFAGQEYHDLHHPEPDLAIPNEILEEIVPISRRKLRWCQYASPERRTEHAFQSVTPSDRPGSEPPLASSHFQ